MNLERLLTSTNRCGRLWFLVALLLILLLEKGFGQPLEVIYVDSAALGPGTGTLVDPFPDLGSALISAASSSAINTTVFLSPGNYGIAAPLTVTVTNGLTITGDTASDYFDRPILTCNGGTLAYLFDIVGSSDIEIQWLQITNCTISGQAMISVNTPGSFTMSDIDISEVDSGTTFPIIQPIAAFDVSILACTFYNIQTSALYYYAGAADLTTYIWNGDFFYVTGLMVDVSASTGTQYMDIWFTWMYYNDCGSETNFAVKGNGIGNMTLYGDTQISESYCSGVGGWPSITMDEAQIFLMDGTGFTCNNGNSIFIKSAIWQNGLDVACGSCNISTDLGDTICAPGINGSCPTGLAYDRCFLCGGSDACIDCNGDPYRAGECNVTRITLANQTSSCTYLGGNPNAVLAPIVNKQDQTQLGVKLVFQNLTEYDSSGTAVRSFDLSNIPYFVRGLDAKKQKLPGAVYSVEFRKDFYDSPAYLRLVQTLVSATTSINFNQFTTTVDPATLKFTFGIHEWNWFDYTDGTGDRLELVVTFKGSQSVQTATNSSKILAPGFSEDTMMINTQDTIQKMTFLNFASYRLINDTSPAIKRPITYSLLSSDPISNDMTYLFVFDGPFVTAEYDPTLSVLIQPSNGGDGGDGSTTLGLAIGLGVGIPLAFGVVVLVILVTLVVVVIKSRVAIRKSRAGSINF